VRRGDGPTRRRCTTPAGRRHRGGRGGTPFPASRPPRHGHVAARGPVRAGGHGAGRRIRYLCVAERPTALKARVLHIRAWNQEPGIESKPCNVDPIFKLGNLEAQRVAR